MDEIDKKIMTELQFDCKQTIKELSDKMNLTPTKSPRSNGFA